MRFKKNGRPTALTPDVAERVIDLLKKGLFRESVCRALGLSPQLLKIWLKRGERESSGIYRDLAERVAEVEVQLEGGLLARLFAAAQQGDPRSALGYLQRRFPQQWRETPCLSETVNSKLSLSDKARHIVDLMCDGEVPPEQARSALSALREATQVINFDETEKRVRDYIQANPIEEYFRDRPDPTGSTTPSD